MPFDDPSAVLSEARELADQGRYEEALQRHMWFHHHALEHDSALYGVRLSFALGDWARLGERHPPARQALVDIRDQAAVEERAGAWSPDLFHDVAAINRCLGEEGETAALFLDLHRADPARAGRVYLHAEPGLAARGLYAVCAAHVPEPMARFEAFRAHRRKMLADMPRIPGLTGERLSDYERIFRGVMEQSFAADVARLLAILTAVGRADEADQVRAAALAEAEDAGAREVIARAGL